VVIEFYLLECSSTEDTLHCNISQKTEHLNSKKSAIQFEDSTNIANSKILSVRFNNPVNAVTEEEFLQSEQRICTQGTAFSTHAGGASNKVDWKG
jgi:hypothetical protein